MKVREGRTRDVRYLHAMLVIPAAKDQNRVMFAVPHICSHFAFDVAALASIWLYPTGLWVRRCVQSSLSHIFSRYSLSKKQGENVCIGRS